MKESLELIEFFKEPTLTKKDEMDAKIMLWDANTLDKVKPLFYSIYYEDKTIYASVVINQQALKYPLNYNISYSSIKQLLVIRSKTIHEILFSLSLALGLELKYNLSNDEIYNLLFEKITDQYKNMKGGYWSARYDCNLV